MKPSKIALLFFGLVGICFVIGFSIGAFPDRWRELKGERSDTLVVLLSDKNLLPVQFLLDFEKATGTRVEIKIVDSYHLYRTEAGQSDVLFAPLSWLGNFAEILKPIPGQNEFQGLLSSDFLTMKFDLNFFLPVLWKTEIQADNREHLLIWGFATPNPQKSEIYDLIAFLLNNRIRLQEWSQFMPLAFTLEESNSLEAFPEKQRADQIRQVSLPNLVIDQKH